MKLEGPALHLKQVAPASSGSFTANDLCFRSRDTFDTVLLAPKASSSVPESSRDVAMTATPINSATAAQCYAALL